MPWSLVRALVGVLASGAAAPAVPEAPPRSDEVGLVWRAPASCPSAATIEALVLEQLGRSWAPNELLVQATVTAEATGHVLDLRLRQAGQEDQRTIRAETCVALGRATALLVALALDPVAVARRLSDPSPGSPEPPERSGEPTPPVAPPSVPSVSSVPSVPSVPSVSSVPSIPTSTGEPTPPEPIPLPPEPTPAPRPRASDASPSRRARPTLRLAPEGGVELGAVPGVTGIVGLATTVAWPRTMLQLSGVYVIPRTQRGADVDVRVMLGAVAARACLRLPVGPVEVLPCGGLEAGAMRGDGRRAPEARTAHGPWLGPGASAGLRVPLTERLALHGRIEAVAALVRPGFRVQDPGDPQEVFAPAAISGRALVGFDVILAGPGDGRRPGRRSEGGSPP
ncbi:MAG: hypothetical protein KDK70_08220 [Myxococcales bacterium]|nr:hypothetical protein [Myxococcales bacterium]